MRKSYWSGIAAGWTLSTAAGFFTNGQWGWGVAGALLALIHMILYGVLK